MAKTPGLDINLNVSLQHHLTMTPKLINNMSEEDFKKRIKYPPKKEKEKTEE